ncbi:MAG: hypothetical protein AAGM36_01145 [Cyanobacteria bacterium J06597_1]
MNSNKTPDRSVTTQLYQFLGGATVGAIMIAVPYSVTSIPFDSLHIGIAAFFVLVCGTLASQFGSSFIETLSKLLANTGLY